MKPRGRKGIRKAIREDYHALNNYDEVGRSWGISGGMAWKFVNEDYYWPASKEIEQRIFAAASVRGIPLGNRGGKDLWSMSPEELLWRLVNREEIGNDHNENAD